MVPKVQLLFVETRMPNYSCSGPDIVGNIRNMIRVAWDDARRDVPGKQTPNQNSAGWLIRAPNYWCPNPDEYPGAQE